MVIYGLLLLFGFSEPLVPVGLELTAILQPQALKHKDYKTHHTQLHILKCHRKESYFKQVNLI